MTKTIRQRYDERMATAKATVATPTARRLMVERIVADIRRDKAVPPLTLCAFLQDHAALIRETLN